MSMLKLELDSLSVFSFIIVSSPLVLVLYSMLSTFGMLILALTPVILVALSIHLYLKNVDVKAKEMAMTSDVIYDLDLGNLNTEGLYHINLKEELLKLVNNEEDQIKYILAQIIYL